MKRNILVVCWLFFIQLLTVQTVLSQNNPFVRSIFTADPSAHVWQDGRLYVYPSHDIDPPRGSDLMDQYHVFSTDDMVHWVDHGEILGAKDVPWGRPEGGFMWAPDCAYKDGTYYFYFPHPSGSDWNNTWKVGIATSKNPASDFEVQGYLDLGDDNFAMIDPTVFVDDDGQAYFYYGGGARCVGARLKDNMTELAEPLRPMEGLEDFHEAAWVHKRDGVYYLSYADNSRGGNRMRYATSDNPLGPWKYQGIYMDRVSSNTTHGSIVEYKGQWYQFYHNSDLSGMGNLRSICFDSLFYNADGTIQKVKQTTGLGASERKIRIDANWIDRAAFSESSVQPENTKNVLWYQQPAKVWEEALPLGNGHLGAMVFGGVADERIQLNDHTLWDGFSVNPDNPEGKKALPEIQRLLFEDKNNEAVKLAEATMMGNPKGVKSYQSLGELWFDTPDLSAENYIRTLDLPTAISSVRYTSNGVNYTREYFVSAPEDVIVVRITADKKEKINLSLAFKRAKDATSEKWGNDGLLLKGRIATKDKDGNQRGVSFASQLKAITSGGTVSVVENIGHEQLLKVKNADTVTLFIAGATNYPGLEKIAKGDFSFSEDPTQKCIETIDRVVKKPYDQIKAEHIADYSKYFGRVHLDLGEEVKEIESLPTDQRIARAKENGTPDLGLVSTYFQFGRYLLVSSSRPNGMPANLQGLWAWQMNAPWNADYHTNINLQMNYWPADPTNLSEMNKPLFNLMEALVRPGEKSAEITYGAKGWVVHHLTDAWGFTAPADGPQGIWPMGAAWLAMHPWQYYTYTGDKQFLADEAWPLMKGAARFMMDFLVEAPAGTAYAGKLVTNPSYSPENSFILPNGQHSVFTYGATMDLEIIHNLLTNCIEASKILKVDADFRKECERTLKRIPDIQISKKTGRIMEWAEDYEEVEPHHRHTSHLFGLYPGSQITVSGTPDLAEAARKTLIARGDDGTGWGLAWKINMWNRLHDGDHSFKLLSVLLSQKTYPNMFDAHPPFQIDGNFGATAAIAEMFLQSNWKSEGNYDVFLLPALPTAMKDKGKITGLKAQGGLQVNLEWEKGELLSAKIYALKKSKVNVHLGSQSKKIKIKKGSSIVVNQQLKTLK